MPVKVEHEHYFYFSPMQIIITLQLSPVCANAIYIIIILHFRQYLEMAERPRKKGPKVTPQRIIILNWPFIGKQALRKFLWAAQKKDVNSNVTSLYIPYTRPVR